MSTHVVGGGFIAQCPSCGWHVFSSQKSAAEALLAAHRCKEES